MKINATEAAALIGRGEKAIRKWCRDGTIPAQKVSRTGYADEWEIDLVELYRATQARGLIEGTRQRVIQAWLDLQRLPPSTSPGESGEIADTSQPPFGNLPGTPGTFRSASEAARWLLTHGPRSISTVRSWPGWPPSSLDPASVLTFALAIYNPRDWRVTWRLHECEVVGCVCHQLL